MIRRSLAGAILGVSLLLGSFAWSGFLALRTVFEPDRSREIAEELLDNDEVRSQLISNLSGAVSAAIPPDVPVSDELVESAAARVLNDPQVEALILRAFTDTHAAFLGDGDAPESIDLTAVAESVRQAVVDAAPGLEGSLPPAPVLNVPLPTDYIPNASPLRSLLQRVVPVLAVAAVAGALLALFTTSDRPAILRRAGVWAFTTTAVYLLIGLGIPWLLRRFAPDGAEVLAALLTALLRSTLAPSIALGVAGAVLLGLSMLWPDGRTQRTQRTPGEERRPESEQVAPRRAAAPRPERRPAQTAARTPRAAAPQRPQPRPQQRPSPYLAQPGQPSPYPDQQPRPASPYPDQAQAAAPPEPEQPSTSVFADVPPPRDMPSRPTPDPSAQAPASTTPPGAPPAPRWVEGLGWVIHRDDPRPPPSSARWVEGVGHVVPGPPPS